MSSSQVKTESPPAKKPRLETRKSDVVAPSDALPDEDTAAPTSTAAGAHSKPLSALFNPTPSTKINKGKGKGKAEDGADKIGFENTLAGLEAAGKSTQLEQVITNTTVQTSKQTGSDHTVGRWGLV